MSSMSQVISSAVEDLMQAVSGDVEAICAESAKYSVDDWRNLQLTKATGLGAAAAAIPVYGYLTLPADIMATLRIMHRCATGICYLKLGHADEETFAGILGVWSGEVTLDDDLSKQVTAKALAASASTVGGQVGLKLSIKAFNLCASTMIAKKIGPKVAQKVAAKLASKLAAKATTRWIPFISAVVGGGTNYWIIESISDASENYANFIKNVSA